MSKVLFLISPTLNSFVDPKKGTSGNKIDCAFKHFGNAAKYNTGIAATAGVAGLVGLTKLKATKAPIAGTFGKKLAQIYKAIPTPVKVAAGAIIATMLMVKNYNKGRIEQKYIDRAQFVDHTFSLDGEGVKPEKKK